MLSPRNFRSIEKAAKSLRGLQGSARLEVAKRARDLYARQAQSAMRSMSSSKASQFASDVQRAVSSAKSGYYSDILNQIADASAREFTADVVRYARGGGMSGLLTNMLNQLGPVGKAVQLLLGNRAIASSIPDSAISSAIELLTGLGFEVRLPGGGTGTQAVPQTHVATGATRAKFPRDRRREYPFEAEPKQLSQPTPERPPIPQGLFPGGLYVPMIRVAGSSNVYAIGYDTETLTMRVQYLAAAVSAGGLSGRGHKGKTRVKGKSGRTLTSRRSGPGPTYDYHGVPLEVFNSIRNAPSKGAAIWDQLRVRGTLHGHQYDYELVAASVVDVILPAKFQGRYTDQQRVGKVTYVPRKAVGPGQFKSRTIRQGVNTFRSLLPSVGLGK